MAQLYVGTSGWAYPSWKPDFYPAKLPQKNFLRHYATQLNTVEVNFTFRQLIKETTAQKWIAETPADFRFGVKAHRSSPTSSGSKGRPILCPASSARSSRWRRQGNWARCCFSCRQI